MKATLLGLGLALVFVTNAQEISGTFALKNKLTGMYARIKDANSANGTLVVAYPPVEWKCVTWNFQHREGHSYQLKNLFTHKTVAASANKKNLTQIEMKGADLPEYEFLPEKNGFYRIRLKNSGLYLTMPADTKTNDPVLLLPKSAADGQLWSLIAQNPSI